MPLELNKKFSRVAPGLKRGSNQCKHKKAGEISTHFSLRLTPDEKALLRRRAGALSVSAYIRKQTLGADAKPRRVRRNPVTDQKALARVLSALGASRLSANINQLAKLANQGALPIDDELASDLNQACAEISAMRHDLMIALGSRLDRES